MRPLQRVGIVSGLVTGLFATAGHYQVSDYRLSLIASARAQQPQTEEEKKRQQKQQQQQKQNPPPQQRSNNPPTQNPGNPPPKQANPQFIPKQGTPPGQNPNNPPPQVKQVNPQFFPKQGTPPGQNPNNPPPQVKQVNPQFFPKQGTPPGQNPNNPPPQVKQVNPQFFPKQGTPPGQNPNNPPPQVKQVNPQFIPKQGTPGTTTFLPKRLDQVQGERKQRTEQGRTIITEPGNRTIIKQDNRIIIRHDETDRFRFGARDVRTTRGPGNTTQTFFMRPDGTRVVTMTDSSGRILRRYRVDRSGREVNLIDNRRFYRNVAIGVGVGILGAAILYNLPRPVVDIPRDRYIVDYDRASDDDLYEALTAPPLMRMERGYSLEEIRDNYSLRERMRSIDLDNVTFESGSFEVTPDQYRQLERVASMINRVLERDPDKVFLIEGHTDATGTAEDNLSLSDRRAQAVAQVLSEQFGVPPENLVTQGYGEQFLKIDTPGPERANRRVTVRPISALMSEAQADRR